MSPRFHIPLAVLATGMLAASCSAKVDLDVVETATEAAVADAQPSPSPEPSPSPSPSVEVTADPTVTGAPTAVPTPTPTTEPTATVAPSPTPAATSTPAPTATPAATATPTPGEQPIEFVIAPDAPLLGVPLGTEAEETVDRLVDLIGQPDDDTGWYPGCPLDGDDDDERLLQWGDLNVYLEVIDGTGVFRAWGYDRRIVDGGFPEVELIQLPGGSQLGDPINEIAEAAGLEVRYDEIFDINRVGEPGYEIVSEAPPGAPAWGAFVPGVVACE